ncbi:MAG: transcription-repair coupling factor [Clostridia bacterium]|nr:transcription-repair coupling factor [Clostridia bacterium]
MNLLTDIIREDGEYRELLSAVRRNFKDKPLPLLANGLCDGATEAFCVALIEDTCTSASPDGGKRAGGQSRTALVVCPEGKDCVRLKQTFERFGLRTAFYTARDLSFYNVTASHEYEHERLRVLSGLASSSYDVVVTTPDAAVSYTVPPTQLKESTIHLDFDTKVDTAILADRLVSAGYARVDMVEGAGQFSLRGGIIDICAPFGCYIDDEGEIHDGTHALRVELFDDEVDRMGLFDTDSQRMVTAIDSCDLLPSREILADRKTLEQLKNIIATQKKSSKNPDAAKALDSELSALTAALQNNTTTGSELAFLDKYIKVIYPESACLLDYFDDRSLLLIRSTSAVRERLSSADKIMSENIKSLIEGGTISGRYTEYAFPPAAFELFIERSATVHVDSLSYGMSGKRLGGIFSFRSKHIVSYAENFRLLCEDLTGYMRSDYRLCVIAENEAAAKNLCELLEDADFDTVLPADASALGSKDIPVGVVVVLWREYLYGFELIAPKIAVLSTNPDSRTGSLSTAVSRARKQTKKKNTRSIMSFADLEVGDYVVHETYGIGRYTGIENLTTAGVSRDYIGIQYAGTDKLYIPVEKMDMVSKYIGAHSDDGLVRLSHLGTDTWNKTKARTRAIVKEMAKDLIKLYAERMRRPGYAFAPDDDFQRDFDAAFEYEETEGQLAAVDDIKGDMQRPVPMDRLLCGDVGYGKTEVALRAAFKAVSNGKQVAVLVPTTILALQHYQTFSRRMRSFSVNVDMLSRFKTAKEQEVTLRRLERGDVDIIIGTHRLLGKDISFKDLGLLIVDEEQRFGVAQKEKLKQMCGNIDVLTLTATPIPRTLNMAMGGIRDISILDEAPFDRLPTQTYVLEHDELIVNEAIRRELRRGGQVFYMHNVVETINEVAAKLSASIPEARITVAHGKMDKEELENIWERMLTGDIDILVCTTIIETGVDIPNANTLIVDCADRLGLSQLHQIRGRVGRSSRRAYAYFTYPAGRAVSEIAEKRLGAIRDYAEFGAGFKIALRDMEIRGAGNLLGAQQHGHIESVGYDLYIKLLNDAVLEAKGEKTEEKQECTVSLDYSAFLPDSYVRYPAQRMALYKRIALIRNAEDMEDMADELIDRYGELPEPALNLLRIALIRAEAVACGIENVRQNGNTVIFTQKSINIDVWMELSELVRGRLKLVAGSEASIRLLLKPGENALKIIHKIFEKYLALSKE